MTCPNCGADHRQIRCPRCGRRVGWNGWAIAAAVLFVLIVLPLAVVGTCSLIQYVLMPKVGLAQLDSANMLITFALMMLAVSLVVFGVAAALWRKR